MNDKIRSICETGVFIGLAVVLRFIFKAIPFLAMPSGGRVSLLMLPIIINAYRNGVKWGIIGAICYAILDFIFDGYFWHIGSIFFDYLFAYGVLGLAGLFKNKINKIGWYVLGILIVCFARYISHGISGLIFFRPTEGYYSTSFWLAFVYSFVVYNGPYMLGSTVLCIMVALPLHKLVLKRR